MHLKAHLKETVPLTDCLMKTREEACSEYTALERKMHARGLKETIRLRRRVFPRLRLRTTIGLHGAEDLIFLKKCDDSAAARERPCRWQRIYSSPCK